MKSHKLEREKMLIFLRELGVHIRKVRRSQGYSQDRLYLEAGFSRGINQWPAENAQRILKEILDNESK